LESALPKDSSELRNNLIACLPSLVIEEVAAESGQRVVYFGHFEDIRIPLDISISALADPSDDESTEFLKNWESWGRVVVKVVGDASADALSRLQAETAILNELRPANFPVLLYSNLFVDNPITDERLPERLYVSIEEFIVSSTLANTMGDYHQDVPAAIELCTGIANALLPLWMHSRRFVHRDIKPENILVRPSGSVVVIDLGIVRETGAVGLTCDGWGKSPLTLDFAAPEQIANDKDAISFKTDFFAIGVLMYRLISGAHPFRTRSGMDNFELANSIERDEPPTLESLGLSNLKVSEFVAWTMRKAPWQRPRTPSVFLEALSSLKKSVKGI
jgi:serine/threonine protein kinase